MVMGHSVEEQKKIAKRKKNDQTPLGKEDDLMRDDLNEVGIWLVLKTS